MGCRGRACVSGSLPLAWSCLGGPQRNSSASSSSSKPRGEETTDTRPQPQRAARPRCHPGVRGSWREVGQSSRRTDPCPCPCPRCQRNQAAQAGVRSVTGPEAAERTGQNPQTRGTHPLSSGGTTRESQDWRLEGGSGRPGPEPPSHARLYTPSLQVFRIPAVRPATFHLCAVCPSFGGGGGWGTPALMEADSAPHSQHLLPEAST